jgi:hypothetical protein
LRSLDCQRFAGSLATAVAFELYASGHHRPPDLSGGGAGVDLDVSEHD